MTSGDDLSEEEEIIADSKFRATVVGGQTSMPLKIAGLTVDIAGDVTFDGASSADLAGDVTIVPGQLCWSRHRRCGIPGRPCWSHQHWCVVLGRHC